jgi:hypothetical protein
MSGNSGLEFWRMLEDGRVLSECIVLALPFFDVYRKSILEVEREKSSGR